MSATNGERVLDFKPVDYDIDDIPPDALEGNYTATIDEVKLSKTKDGYPMLILNWKITEADDADNAGSVGATVSDFLTFYPSSEGNKSKMGKLKLRQVLDMTGIDRDVVPTSIGSKDDFADLMGALEGQSGNIIVKHRDFDGETRCNVSYPKATVETQEERPAKGKTAPAKKPAKRR